MSTNTPDQARTPFGFARIVDGDRDRLAVVVDASVIRLDDLLPSAPTDFAGLLDGWDGWVRAVGDALDELIASVPSTRLDDARFLAPVVDRPAVYCAGGNYRDHLKEMGVSEPGPPYHFISPPRVLGSPGADVVRPPRADQLDWEVELTLVIGRQARSVSREDALSYVAGYTIANDVSVRGSSVIHPIFGVDWMLAKNGEGLTPVGPVVVPAALYPNPENRRLSLWVNGVVRQDSNTSQLIYGIAEQIEALSAVVTLEPGDLILTGTPAGTAAAHGQYLADGDVMTAHVDGLGELVNSVRRSPASTTGKEAQS